MQVRAIASVRDPRGVDGFAPYDLRSVDHEWGYWERPALESGLPLYVLWEWAGLVRFGHASGGDPPTVFTVIHWPWLRPAMLAIDTRRRSRRVTSELFDEVGPRCDPHVRVRPRRQVAVSIDGTEVHAPLAAVDGRFVIAVELADHDLVIWGRAEDPEGLALRRVDPGPRS